MPWCGIGIDVVVGLVRRTAGTPDTLLSFLRMPDMNVSGILVSVGMVSHSGRRYASRMTRTPLCDDHLWILVNRDSATSLAELARRFGAPMSTVSMAAKRIRDRGWTCSVSYGLCAVCWEPFTRQGHKAGRRAYHADCRPQAIKRLNAGYDERRWQEAADDARQARLNSAHAYTRHHQRESAERATNRGQRWQAWEDEFILDHSTLTTSEMAIELGRTLYAVTARRRRLRAQFPGTSD